MALIGGPALLVALCIVVGMWRDAGEIVRRRERGVAWTSASAGRTPDLGPASPGAQVISGSGPVALPITWARPAVRRPARRPPRTTRTLRALTLAVAAPVSLFL